MRRIPIQWAQNPHLSKWKTYFPQFIDKFLETELWGSGMSYSRKKIQAGGIEDMDLQGYQRNSMFNFRGLIKNEVEFPRATKKK